ncbi:AAEL012463-PA [Aedes aegypti]|uniref:AAEL012463-PA n=1 Tax=Aedes aegypti TaxID=7159 RepID=Q16M12_AEDAE|nr:AAEL012463-PA [Aedes aegypti]
MKHLGQSSSINHRSNNSLIQPQHQQSQRLHQSNVLSQSVVHAASQSSSGSMVPHQGPTGPSTQHPHPSSVGPSPSFHHMQPAAIPPASIPPSAGAPNYHHHHHHHHHQAAAMLTLAVSNPPAPMPLQHHQQNINLNVNHHLISAPIVVDFSNMTVNCVQLGQENQQHLQQQPPSLVGTGHNVGPMGNNGGSIVPGSTGGRLK